MRSAFSEVADEPWVSFPKSNPARRWLDDNSRKAGFRPVISAEIETFTQMKAFVEAGHGIALAPAELIEHELALGLLRAVPSIEPRAAITIGYAFDERVTRRARDRAPARPRGGAPQARAPHARPR